MHLRTSHWHSEAGTIQGNGGNVELHGSGMQRSISMTICKAWGNPRKHSFEVIDGGRTLPAAPAVSARTAVRAADAGEVVQHIAAARRRFHPEAPVLWIAPCFPVTPDDR
jgi:hypothetical protein